MAPRAPVGAQCSPEFGRFIDAVADRLAGVKGPVIRRL
jgi:hypothetical protein